MPRKSDRLDRSPRSACPISLALEILGDAWTLLIVRDLMFKERRTFKEFLEGGEGIASNILADRLQRLEAAQIIVRQGDPADARRFVYRLTRKGIDLAPVLIELVIWSARYERTDAPAAIVREMRDDREAFLADLRRRWQASGAAAGGGSAKRARPVGRQGSGRRSPVR